MGTNFLCRKTEKASAAREEFIFERKDFMKFKVVGKNLILTDHSHKIIEGENSFDTVEIAVPKKHDDCDISNLSFRFSEISENGETAAVQVLRHTKCDEKYIYLKGIITSDFSAITGKVTFMLTGVNGENVVAKFQSDPFTVNDDISLASLPNETTAEQLFNQTQLEVAKAIDAANRAEKASQTPAPAEIYPATDKRLGGIKSGNDIYVSESGSVTVNSVNGKTIGKSVPDNAVFTDTVYMLPKATTKVLGGVKVDGKTITANSDGTISASDSENIKAEIAELKSLIGFTDSDIIGLHADFENTIFTRLAGAVGKNAGNDFDIFPMYGGRRRCNVLDDGTITAYFGDSNFAEDGSNGQVMVYQPKFYYKVVPLKLDPQTNGYGYHLRSANYYISATPKNGFKLHPAFYNEDGDPVDYILSSAYEGSIFDTSANAYLRNDEQIVDFSTDKLSSVAGVKPCSGKSQSLTRTNVERLAQNRSKSWHCDTIKAESANQILMAIEYASFNSQIAVGQGIVSSDASDAFHTGQTSFIGNDTGNSNGDVGKSAVSYRGAENLWGNIWTYINGINEYTDNDKICHVYICSNYEFMDTKNTDNYADIGFSAAKINGGYISAFGYSDNFDWLFIPSLANINYNSAVSGTYYCSDSTNTWQTAIFGGRWNYGNKAGLFALGLNNTVSATFNSVGARLIYIPRINKTN